MNEPSPHRACKIMRLTSNSMKCILIILRATVKARFTLIFRALCSIYSHFIQLKLHNKGKPMCFYTVSMHKN